MIADNLTKAQHWLNEVRSSVLKARDPETPEEKQLRYLEMARDICVRSLREIEDMIDEMKVTIRS